MLELQDIQVLPPILVLLVLFRNTSDLDSFVRHPIDGEFVVLTMAAFVT